MLHLDATQLYDLSEAGDLLYRDPARLAREARLRVIPSARVEAQVGLPVPWVDAESGNSPADPEALRDYWLARLEPPSREARRAGRDRGRLPTEDLLGPDEAAQRIFASADALARLDMDGTLPSLRVDGHARYDAVLTGLVARESEGADVAAETEARRAEVLAWARFEYESKREVVPPPVEPPGVDDTGVSPDAPAESGDAREDAGPAAYEIPTDLFGTPLKQEPPKKSTLSEAEGFETVDED